MWALLGSALAHENFCSPARESTTRTGRRTTIECYDSCAEKQGSESNVRNERIRVTTKVCEISGKVLKSQFRWLGHVERQDREYGGEESDED